MSAPVAELTAYYKECMAKPLPDLVPFEKKLRVSGFPYCGLKHGWEKLTNHVSADGDALKDFYTSVGTAAHLTFQRWLGVHGRLYGDWKCRSSQCKHVVHFSNKHRCPKCKTEMEYEEFTVRYGKHVTGHLDGVYKDSNRRYWVIDYKTSSVRNVDSQRSNPTFPYAKNRAQILSYVALIEQMYDIEIAGWMLLYIARDHPLTLKVVGEEATARQKELVLKTIRKYDTQYDTVLNLQKFDQLSYLIRTKPCKSYEFYLQHLKGFSACPLESVCFTKRLTPMLEDLMADYLDERKKPQ